MKAPLRAALLLPGLLAATCDAGVIRGTLSVPAPPPPAHEPTDGYPGRAGSLPGRAPIVRGLAGDAVVYVERVPAATEAALARAAAAPSLPRLAQKDQRFVPRVVAIAIGTEVGFPNLDPIYHNVFSLSPTRRFDLGKYPRGQSRSVRFEKPGLVNVYCDIHSDMAAFIVVTPNHAFARPGDGGAFALPDLPPGAYSVCIWHPDLGSQRIEVQVPASGDVTVAARF